MSDKKFVTAINCMDGRVQEPIITWMKHHHNADFIDMITEPGPIKDLSKDEPSPINKSIKKRVEISVQKHGSTIIAIIGHHDCAGNPVDQQTQYQQINQGIKTVQKWGLEATIIGLWIDANWDVHKLS